MMRKLIERILENRSTKEIFLFRASCACCGKEYGNKPIRFSKADIVPSTESKKIIYEALYEQEQQDVRQAAVRNAAEHLNYCPICKRLVCNQCFMICDDIDMCVECAAQLQEFGKPVISETEKVSL